MIILDRSVWTKTPNGRADRPLDLDLVTGVTLHYPGAPSGTFAGLSQDQIIGRIQGWYNDHVEGNNWVDIGYNYAIDQSGRIYNLTGLTRGAHGGSTANSTTVGVLLILGPKEEPSADMIVSLQVFRLWLLGQAPWARDVSLHSDWMDTDCPGPQVQSLRKSGLISDLLHLPDEGLHVVAAGDTLSAISRIHQVDLKKLIDRNGIQTPNLIEVGQMLVIPAVSSYERLDQPRLFRLVRGKDSTGVSGVGVVAEGIQFSDGHVAMRWCVGESKSTSVWSNIRDVEAIHGHDGDTQVVWRDE